MRLQEHNSMLKNQQLKKKIVFVKSTSEFHWENSGTEKCGGALPASQRNM
jgi:hypothetical protein